MIEQFFKNCGFESEREFYQMIAKLDLSLPGNLDKFNNWKNNNGTKSGLINIFPELFKKENTHSENTSR